MRIQDNYKQVKLLITVRSQTLINKTIFTSLCWRIQLVKSCTTKENPEPGKETSREQGNLMAGNQVQY